MSELKIGSLFSGYGGLDLAVEAVTGAQPAWFCEWDEAPSRILAHKHIHRAQTYLWALETARMLDTE